MKLSTDSLCGLCGSNIETIQHLMSECPQSNELWSNICSWIKNVINVDVCLSSLDKILGYVSSNNNFIPLNFIIIYSRKYIFWCTRNKCKLNFYVLQKMLKITFLKKKAWLNCTLNQKVLTIYDQTGNNCLSIVEYCFNSTYSCNRTVS